MDQEQTTSADGAPARKHAPSALQSLIRWLLGLWWVFIVALGGSIAQYLGNHSGPLVVTAIPQFIANVRHEPLGIQVGLAFTTLAILIIAVMLTWLAWVDRNARVQEEADAVIADQKEAFDRALVERVGPQLTALTEQAGETHAVVAMTGEKVNAVAVVTTETRDIASETLDVARGIAERQNQPALLPAGVTITPVRDLKREDFKLGDNSAANRDFIVEPFALEFNAALQELGKASSGTGSKRGLLILGAANAGKTRLALEALIRTLPDWERLGNWGPSRSTAEIPPAERLVGRKIVLFVDDAHEYAISSPMGAEGRAQMAIGPSDTLKTLWETIKSNAASAVLVATCRSSEEQRLRGSLGWLFTDLAVITVPTFNENIHDPVSAHVIALFEPMEAGLRAKWDGTIGSLTLGVERKREEYDKLAEGRSSAIPVLHAMKLLVRAGVTEHTETRIRHVCKDILAAPQVLDDEGTWQQAVSDLTDRQFVTETPAANNQLALTIRKDTYFDDVVADYPDPLRPFSFLQQRRNLRPMFFSLTDDDALFDLGNGWFDAGDYEEAAKAYSDCVSLRPSWGNAQYNKALALSLDKRDADAIAAWEKTLDVYEESLRLDTSQADIWSAKGDALFTLKRYAEALAAYEQALDRDSSQAQWWADKGDVLYNLERYAEALAAFEQALRLDPQQASVWDLKGDTLLQLKRHEEAREAYQEALDRDPSQAAWWNDLANALGELNRHEEEIAAYEQALKLDPSQAWIWRNKAGVLIESLKRYAEALEACERALALESTSVRGWSLKGQALDSLGRRDEARITYEQALALPAEDVLALENRSLAFSGLGRHQEALAAIEQALALDPENAACWHQKGRALIELRRFAEALAALEQLLALDRDDADAWEEKAKALHALGREDEARQAEEQARTLREQQA